MSNTLEEEYPEAAPHIRRAVEDHSEQWVLNNYYQELYPLGQIMAMPEIEELPFYDEDEYEGLSKGEQKEMYQALAQYRENLRTGTKPGE